MRLCVLVFVVFALLPLKAAWADDEYVQVIIDDPFIELHSGPGRGYPVFYIAERGEQIVVRGRFTRSAPW